jgi:tRNA G46 methylase TrmB
MLLPSILTQYSPISPAQMNWSSYYPAFAQKALVTESSAVVPLTKDVEVADIGCGFGGLLVALAPLMPDTLLLGTLKRSSKSTFTYHFKGWRFEPKSRNTSKNESKP